MPTLNPGRLAAVRVLMAVEKGAHADLKLNELAPASGLDRSLSWHLALGVLRRQGCLDPGIQSKLRGRGLDALDPPIRAALRVGLFEIWFSNTPPHAAVDQAVRACRASGGARGSGLVNAVLRKLTKTEPVPGPNGELPLWLWERWSAWPEWVSSLAEPAPLQGVWNGNRRAQLAVENLSVDRGTFQLPPGAGKVSEMPGFASGDWWVMDSGSVRCADTLSDALKPGSRVLDCCAAPGGKSMRLASLGHTVTATDSSSNRLDLLKEAGDRLSLEVTTRVHDWELSRSPELGEFDGVIVDAPCTGLGTIRRRPEIRWKRLASDPAAQAIRQLRILRNAATHVGHEGSLVYSVCSPTKEEGRGVIGQLDGWQVTAEWRNLPPLHGEDVFQCYVLQRDNRL